MRSSKEDTETTATLETAVDYSPPPKRRQHVTCDRENSRQTLLEILEGPDRMGQTVTQTSQFWSHPVVVALETIAIYTLLTRRLWLLKGIFFVLTACIVSVVQKWMIYTIRNEELRRAKKAMITYFSIAMREAEKTIRQGGKARRLVEASALALRGTAQSFTLRYLKQRNSALLKQIHIDMATLKQRAEIIREKFNIDMSLSKQHLLHRRTQKSST